jgi:hypothetical protein
MAEFKKTELKLDHRFDPFSCRHTLNGQVSVLHCHHYSTLYTQLAEDCGMLDGVKLLKDCAEDTFLHTLKSYYAENDVATARERVALAEQYFAAMGLGKLQVVCAGSEAGQVRLEHSHVDAGWIKKWGKRDKPVNHIGCGYIAALFSAVFDRPARSYAVTETASIVAGAERSEFNVVCH